MTCKCDNCHRGKLPASPRPNPNSNSKPNPNPNPNQETIFFEGNCPDTTSL